MDFEKLAVGIVKNIRHRLCLESSGRHEVWCSFPVSCSLVVEAMKDASFAEKVGS